MMDEPIERLKKVATLGGPIKVRKDKAWIYGLDGSNPNLGKEKLFGARGPLHPGMPYKQELAVGATQSDTRATLIRELVEQSHLTRREAEDTVNTLISSGTLVEVDHPDLGKVLVLRGMR